jgi:hypothetical protein
MNRDRLAAIVATAIFEASEELQHEIRHLSSRAAILHARLKAATERAEAEAPKHSGGISDALREMIERGGIST